mgnify:CR=1 FL=1|tara:strand:- start:29292 stop:30848 length:1557 start_codon:yes stop_codon:yes gene_type:complete
MSLFETETIVGSTEQEAFWKELVDGNSHIFLEARAGTGKTFSCIEGCKRYLDKHPDAKIAMVAYNKSIATELQEKVPAGVTACTMHSLGFKAVRERYGKVKVDNWKTANIAEKLMGKRQWKGAGASFQMGLRKVVSLAKNTLLDWEEDYTRQFNSLVAHYNLQLNGAEEAIKALLPEVLQHSEDDVLENGIIDFDDMIWLPTLSNCSVDTFDMLFVDEAQDLNKSRQELALNAVRHEMEDHGRLIVVGDPKQAIYGFAGADAYSMINLRNRVEHQDVMTLPLTITRRCPKSHVALAQEIVEDIKPMDDAIEGTVTNMPIEALYNDEQFADPNETLVLCRMNAPLMAFAYQCISRDIPCMIQGKDIGSSLSTLCNKLAGKNISMSIPEFQTRLSQYHIKEIQRLDAKAIQTRVSKTAYEMLGDKVQCIELLCKGADIVGDVINRIKKLFDDTSKGQRKNKIVLSSVHRAKGLEADTVYILEEHMMPHPMAELEWEIGQEHNIRYVALTRSKNTLVFVRK